MFKTSRCIFFFISFSSPKNEKNSKVTFDELRDFNRLERLRQSQQVPSSARASCTPPPITWSTTTHTAGLGTTLANESSSASIGTQDKSQCGRAPRRSFALDEDGAAGLVAADP